MSSNNKSTTVPSKTPFVIVGLGWVVLAFLLCLLSAAPVGASAKWLLGVWALCMLDLLAIANAIAAVVQLMTSSEDEKAARMIAAFFWGSVKLVCLGVLVLVIWSGQEAPHLALFLGVGTLVVVPLVGGFWWSQKELKYA